MIRRWSRVCLIAGLMNVPACADDEATPSAPSEAAEPSIDPEAEPSLGYKADGVYTLPADRLDAITLPADGSLQLNALHPALLVALEEGGLSFGEILSTAMWGQPDKAESNAELYNASPWYRSVADHLADALDDIASGGEYTYGAEPYVKRLFNKGWLSSPDARFELIGVVNRLDRTDMYAGTPEAPCGELRLLYRLAYARGGEGGIYSRMPFVFNAVYEVMAPDARLPESLAERHTACKRVAERWRMTDVNTAYDYVAWWRQRADVADVERLRFRQLEVNFQAVRLPSESKPELGGHAEYVMRVFAPTGDDQLAPIALENTPDVERLKANPALKAELRDYLLDHIVEIDSGLVQIPERFLARAVTSFTTHGLHRPANKRFSALFDASDLAAADLSAAKHLRSPEALLMRLDDMTCAGCHQGRSVAGFHMLGLDRANLTHPLNALRLPGSPHFVEEEARRSAELDAMATGATPEVHRPLSFEPLSGVAPVGAPCIPEESMSQHLAEGWSCAAGLSCRVTMRSDADVPIGVCVRPAAEPVAGDVCQRGDLVAHATDPRKDEMKGRLKRFGCGGYACLPPVEGTPGGLCYAHCDTGSKPRNAHELCAYNGGASFDTCAASGDWSGCILQSTRRGLRQACDESTPCRDDYICQRFYEFDDGGVRVPEETRGYCVPNYFLYQLRLDGHPHDP